MVGISQLFMPSDKKEGLCLKMPAKLYFVSEFRYSSTMCQWWSWVSDIAHALEGSSQQAPAHLPSPFCPVDAEAVLRTVGISVTVIGHSSRGGLSGGGRHWIRVTRIAVGLHKFS